MRVTRPILRYHGGKWKLARRLERVALADGAKKRTEILWFNPAAWNARPQMELMPREECVC